MSDPALGLLMLSLIVVVIMLGFPTAFTLMGLGMFFGFIAFHDPAKAFLAARSKEQMLIARNTAMNAQFEKRCKEDARVTIKRVIENVDGVFIMKPRKVATSELQDQFWMGDPYGYTMQEAERPQTLLYDDLNDSRGRPRITALSGYKFVELPNLISGKIGSRPYIRWTGAEPSSRGYAREVDTEVDQLASRYGFDWDDISTPEDRTYWIAGGRTRVIDLQTKEVIAERVGYLVDPMQGGASGRRYMAVLKFSCLPGIRKRLGKNIGIYFTSFKIFKGSWLC